MKASGLHEEKINKNHWFVFVFLYLLTLVSQISFPFYHAVQLGENYLPQLLPSVAFLSILSLPSIAIGLMLGPKIGIGIVNAKAADKAFFGLMFALVTGVCLGGLLLLLRVWLSPFLPEELPDYGFRGVIGGVLVSLGAAVGEEVWFRFGLLTLVLFLIQKWRNQTLSHFSVWAVFVTVAVLFGAAHLPQLVSYGAGSSFAIGATIAGNMVVSLLFSWCFWRYGLASAILAHFSVDIVLHSLSAIA